MCQVPDNLQYTKEHEWLSPTPETKTFRVGITDYAQSALGDIVYIQLPKVGEELIADKVCGEVESTKSVSEIYSPVSGKVITINSELDKAPEVVNTDPYGAGWIFEILVSDDPKGLLTAAQYSDITP